jgi:hypothetical protein
LFRVSCDAVPSAVDANLNGIKYKYRAQSL